MDSKRFTKSKMQNSKGFTKEFKYYVLPFPVTEFQVMRASVICLPNIYMQHLHSTSSDGYYLISAEVSINDSREMTPEQSR